MSLHAHLLAERNVPRYTSYPTAPHFSPRVNAEVHARWLAEMPDTARLSLYLHVPFCRELCHYCGCHTKAVRRREPIDEYAADLVAEIRTLAQRLGPHAVSQIHWGGGTPSMLGRELLLAVTAELDCAFAIGDLREHAIELDPRHVDRTLAGTLFEMGVSRASLGVQEFAPHVQQAIGRVQPYETILRAVEVLRSQGIVDLNFDLMYGLPRQRIDDVRASAETACRLAPQRIALFGYAHVPWMKKHQRLIDIAQLPGPAERLAQAEAARQVFLAHGYVAIGFNHFALPGDALALAARGGTLHRNFQGYTCDDADALIGIGASAISRLPQGYAQNAPDLAGYSRAVQTGALATVRGIALTADDRLRASIIERIMCDLRVDLRGAAGGAGFTGFAAELASLRPLADEGLVRIDDGSIEVTEYGRPFVRLVAAAFDAYFQPERQRHSLAV